MRILIVDDEPLAQELLEFYIQKVPGLELAGTCGSAMEALAMLNKVAVDLLLLDINMPEISGLEFLRMLRQPPPVILTTAYAEFALSGYDMDVVDYLMKPIPFERFLKAIQRSRVRAGQRTLPSPPADRDILFVRADGRFIRIELETLQLVEGLKDYLKLWLDGKSLIVHSTMKNLEAQLSGRAGFIRVSKSSIVNLQHVSEVEGNMIRVAGHTVTIGATYREAVQEMLNRRRLL